LLRRAGQLEQLRDRCSDPRGRRPRQPHPRPSPSSPYRARPVTRPSVQRRGGITVLGVRTLAIGVALFALAVAGCGGDDNGGGGGGGASGGGDKTAKVAFVYPTTTTNFAQE